MLEYIKEFGTQIIALFILSVAIYTTKTYGKKFLKGIINSLIQTAEANIKGSKLGAEKKAWVISQLESAGIKITKNVEKTIDNLVAIMNEQKTSITKAVSKSK